MHIRNGTQNVRSLCWSGSLKTKSRKLAKYKLDSMGVKDFKRDETDISR
jgi:hypothetical protein